MKRRRFLRENYLGIAPLRSSLIAGDRLPAVADAVSIPGVCEQCLSFLVERHGFEPPETERIGRETFVRYHRGDRTVSVAWEPGLTPIVELFYPPQTPEDRVAPWAERNGVARARRIPRLRVPAQFDASNLKQAHSYFAELGSQLGQQEEAWLAT
jgi:hypothetical protein